MIITGSLQLEFVMFETKKVKHLLLPASELREFILILLLKKRNFLS